MWFTVEKFYKANEFMDLPVVEFENITAIYPQEKYKLFAPINYKNLIQIVKEFLTKDN